MSHEIHQVDSPAAATRVAEFFKTIWQDGDDVAPFDLILATQHVGGYCAFIETDGNIQAASYGVRGSFRGEQTLHSHVTASKVSGLGYQLKLHQREWAKSQGLAAITWTFDPLVRRNAVFNFMKLGAVAVEYLPNFYGSMTDSINVGDESDRLFAYWPTNNFAATPNLSGESSLVELPADIETLRQNDRAAALQWRTNVRHQLQPLFDQGAIIRTMNPERTALVVEKVAN